jgi:hypothetical protein
MRSGGTAAPVSYMLVGDEGRACHGPSQALWHLFSSAQQPMLTSGVSLTLDGGRRGEFVRLARKESTGSR